jgi:hypothetical protein
MSSPFGFLIVALFLLAGISTMKIPWEHGLTNQIKNRIKLQEDIRSRLGALNTSLLKKMMTDKVDKEQAKQVEQEKNWEREKMKMKILQQEARKEMEMQRIIQGVMYRYKCVKRLFC